MTSPSPTTTSAAPTTAQSTTSVGPTVGPTSVPTSEPTLPSQDTTTDEGAVSSTEEEWEWDTTVIVEETDTTDSGPIDEGDGAVHIGQWAMWSVVAIVVSSMA